MIVQNDLTFCCYVLIEEASIVVKPVPGSRKCTTIGRRLEQFTRARGSQAGFVS